MASEFSRSIDLATLSKAMTALRFYLLKNGFFEQHLYSTLPYKIRSTDTFSLKRNLHLRFNPEPDIWNIGETFEKFFFLGSLFRNEPRTDVLHRYEFTVLDVYLPHGTQADVISLFRKLLSHLERRLHLKSLSRLPVRRISHREFNASPVRSERPTWFIVTAYPRNESFYDTAVSGGTTKKFELFYVDRRCAIEITACGELGDNANPEMYVKEVSSRLSSKLRRKKFIGFGIGLERLLHVYAHVFPNVSLRSHHRSS